MINEFKKLLHYNDLTGDFTHLSGRNKGKIAGGIDNSTGYLQLWVLGKKYRLHQLAWLFITGKFSTNIIDHKNRIKTDNRACNLREVTSSVSNLNRNINSNNTSGVTGLSWDKTRQKWNVKMIILGKAVCCRYFLNKSDAISYLNNIKLKYKDCL